MAKGKPKPKQALKESAKTVMAGVRKEMNRPRVAESARKKRSYALTLPKLFTFAAAKPVEIKP
jgi:hypothetical protein